MVREVSREMNGSGFSDRTRLMADVSFGGRGFSS